MAAGKVSEQGCGVSAQPASNASTSAKVRFEGRGQGQLARVGSAPVRVADVEDGLDAAGAPRTLEALATLESLGYRTLTGRLTADPGSRARHVVVGPTGVHVVETRAWSWRMRLPDGLARIIGRSAIVEQVLREADAVAVVIPGTQVTPMVCVHGGGSRLPPFEIDGVRVVRPTAMVAGLRDGPIRLDLMEISRLTAQLDARLPRAA